MNGSLAIPDGLKQQFVKLEQRLWRFDTIVAACGAVGSLILSFAFIFISDRLWDTPALLRIFFTGAGVAGFCFFVYSYGKRWVWGDRSFPALASLVQRRYRRLGDRLLGIVELADEHKRPANFSPALCKAAIDQVATEASKVDFQQAVGTKRPRQYFIAMLVAGAVAAGFCILAPQAGWNAFMRWLKPGVNVERYTFVNFDNLPDHLVVAHGEPFELAVGLNANSLLHPTEVTAQFENQAETSSPVKSGVAVLKLAGQTKTVMLSLSAGDVKKQIRIEPAYRPELKMLSAHVEFPSYLQYPVVDQKVEGGSFTFLNGSRVTFQGQASRPLKQATVDVAKKVTQLKVDSASFFTEPALLQGAAQWVFTWKDQLGLDAVTPVKVRLQQKEDAAPQVDCRGMAGTIAILEEEVVHIDIVADDDYGIKDVGVRWQTASDRSDKPSAPTDVKIGEGSAQSKTFPAKYDFSPKLLHIPPDTAVAFCATATDRYPGRPAALSTIHQIYVLSREKHAELIREQLEKLNAELEELTRRQESLVEAAKATKEQDPAKLADADTAKKLADQAQEQKETAEQLEKLANKTADTMKEAVKNPEISPATLQQWAKNAEAMDEMAQKSMPQAAQSLEGAQSDPQKRGEKLEEASQQEQEILKKMREMQNEAEKGIQKLMSQNLAARLRKIATSEKSITDQFQKILPDVIGAKTTELADPLRTAIEDMARLQDNSRKDSTKLQNEISRLGERTKLDRYNDVAGEMEKSATDEALQKTTDVIKDNVTVQAIQSTADWNKQYTAWADRIEDKDDSQSEQSQGGQGGQGGQQDMKALMELLKLKQQQEAVRDKTSALEQQKQFNKDYQDETQKTAGQQEDIQKSIEQLQADPDFPVPAKDLAPIAKAMKDAKGSLDRPDTGEPTISAQTDAINMLDQVIMEQAKKSGKSMASLMQMAGSGGQPKPGNQFNGQGYFGGGTTDRANVAVGGSRNGGVSEHRNVIQAGGNGSAPLPTEFRDAIESYQRAVEQEKTTP